MNINQKYIKCFNQKKSAELIKAGFSFLFEKSGVYYHSNNEQIIKNFSDNDFQVLNNTKYSSYIPL